MNDSNNPYPVYSTAYLPPASWLLSVCRQESFSLEKHEHFVKQSYRNRACICGPNGKQNLIIPVVHENLFRTRISEVRISYEENWQINHWRTIESAYRNSPYFDFLEDYFKPFYQRRFDLLFEFNLEILKTLFRIVGKSPDFTFTSDYRENLPVSTDFRNNFHPKKPQINYPSYHQVFSDKHGFVADLSVLDWVCCDLQEARNQLAN